MTQTLPKITFEKAQGGLGRPLPNEDHVSGILVYVASLPTGFGTDRVKRIIDLPHAESLGIVPSTDFEILHYHISEFFRINPGAELYAGIFTATSPQTYDEVLTMQYAVGGKIRQLAVYDQVVLTEAIVLALHAHCLTLEQEYQPLSLLFAPDISAVVDLTALTDLRDLASECPNVSICIGQDGAGAGYTLFDAEDKSISCVGALLGAISKAAVNESIAWVGKFNMAYLTTELDTPALANGMLINTLTPSELEALNALGYIFLIKHIGVSGTYFNDSHTCTLANNDYNAIELERVIDKAIRNVRTYMLPELSRPIYVDPNSGKLRPDSVAYLQDKAGQALAEMERAGELSGWRALINPDQNILTTSEIEIVIAQVPVGVARQIKIKIGYTTKLN